MTVAAGDHAARGIALPSAVVATSGARGRWADARRDPADAFWLVSTADAALVRTGHRRSVSFEAPVAPGRTLAHPTLAGVATSKRLLCVRDLSPTAARGPAAASGAAAAAGRFDWLARWLVDLGLPALADLTRAEFLDFQARLRAGGPLALVDLPGRLAALDDAALGGAVRIGPRGGPDLLALDAGTLGRMAGITAHAVAGPAFRAALAARLGLRGPAVPPMTSGAALVNDYMDCWKRLHDASAAGELPDPLVFDPFEGRSNYPNAARTGRGGRTATIEPHTLFDLLNEATRFLLVEGPGVVAALSGAARDGGDGAAALSTLRTLVRRLMAACAIIIGGLLARRRGEILSLRAGRLPPALPGLGAVTFWIEKSLRRLDDVVAPPLVVEAVRTLELLAAASGRRGAEWLFKPSLGERAIDFDPARDLRLLLASSDEASVEALATHQLRRAHAILLGHGWALGSVDLVARQLRHADAESPAIYMTEAEAGRMSAFADACRAARARLLGALGAVQRDELADDLARLRLRRDEGMAADRARSEDAALLLLEDWASGAGGDAGRVARPAVRIGSQVVPPPTDERPLLDLLLAGADACSPGGLL